MIFKTRPHILLLQEEPENEMENASRMSEEKAKFDLYINEQIIERIPAKYEHEKLQRERNINLFNPSTSEGILKRMFIF